MRSRDIEHLRQPLERGGEIGLGAGLGLTPGDTFVQLHGSEMKITSGPSRGTQVTSRLPITAGDR